MQRGEASRGMNAALGSTAPARAPGGDGTALKGMPEGPTYPFNSLVELLYYPFTCRSPSALPHRTLKRCPMNDLLKTFRETSLLYGGNAPFLEELYERYLEDPGTIEPAWRSYFDHLHGRGPIERLETPHRPIREAFERIDRHPSRPAAPGARLLSPEASEKQAAVLRLINYYRVRGHEVGHLDPLALQPKREVPDLDPAFHGLSDADMDTLFHTGSLQVEECLPLREIIAIVRETYCGTIGAEYMHINDTPRKRWIQKQLEPSRGKVPLDAEYKRWILRMLSAAEGLEKYLHRRYVGQKRFSLEGAESLIPMLDDLLQKAGEKGVKETVIGMAHRGRLNVLVNILGKSTGEMFQEFEGKVDINGRARSGDVKYHQGFSSNIDSPGGPMHLALAFNPSHLEIIGPVVEGSVRARQQRRQDLDGSQVLPVLIHGDAAFAGQGVVMETFSMSRARCFSTGGTVHIIVNNQIGFTTSNPRDARSTVYPTEVAKMVQAPIFHVNADDPEAVILVTRLALDFRMTFHRDVVIDLVCYRRLGHNEADEPSVTQPMMYDAIRHHPTVVAAYANRLIEGGIVNPEGVEEMATQYRAALDRGEIVSRPVLKGIHNPFASNWKPYLQTTWTHPVDTTVPLETLQRLAERTLSFPQGFELHARVAKIMADRRKMAAGEVSVDWGFAEMMAYATLLHDGYPVRLSGQDTCRGTFFHRHAVVRNQRDGRSYVPLQHVSETQAQFIPIDSLLSEEAVLAYEYGYATAEPNGLTLWEAQFGDFANGAQVVIDQFITSGEVKWQRLCGLVLLLPHGYEGQGPEHSSARLERFLQMCAEHNIQVCAPTTPAQIFHLLRRQMVRPYRKPLVVMTPKSLLRHKLAVSPLDCLVSGGFRPVIGDDDSIDAEEVTRIVLCSGKVYYDLLQARRAEGLQDIAIVRLEQLHPFPEALLATELSRYPQTKRLIWCQEEPQNQGAWYQIQHHIRRAKPKAQLLRYAGRSAAASPAVGYYDLHLQQQEALVASALHETLRTRAAVG
jgi:2-oxoglutarate dehydrogenase E1 component